MEKTTSVSFLLTLNVILNFYFNMSLTTCFQKTLSCSKSTHLDTKIKSTNTYNVTVLSHDLLFYINSYEKSGTFLLLVHYFILAVVLTVNVCQRTVGPSSGDLEYYSPKL